jgi:hypothetical protein
LLILLMGSLMITDGKRERFRYVLLSLEVCKKL